MCDPGNPGEEVVEIERHQMVTKGEFSYHMSFLRCPGTLLLSALYRIYFARDSWLNKINEEGGRNLGYVFRDSNFVPIFFVFAISFRKMFFFD